jgi:aspartyl-tRNA(Asn)/glutamyl-tRNA(Gln) amidotransferase subunit A
MATFDLVLTPTLPITAFDAGADHPASLNGEPTTYLGWTKFTYPFNITGQPVATVPVGFDGEGLPVGMQIIGRWRADDTVLRASAAFEALQPWHGRRPDLASA